MPKNLWLGKATIFLGVLVLILPMLGLPAALKNLLLIASGFFIGVFSLLFFRAAVRATMPPTSLAAVSDRPLEPFTLKENNVSAVSSLSADRPAETPKVTLELVRRRGRKKTESPTASLAPADEHVVAT